ncbi:MAG: hypothetical protein ACKOTB_07125 [Planctomycetia bacterium]
MLSTLFHIPTRLTLGGTTIPLAGFGVLLFAWAVMAAAALWWTAARQGWRAAVESLGVPLAIAAAVIVWL